MRKIFFDTLLAAGPCARMFGAPAAAAQTPEAETLRPSDFVKGFPALTWGNEGRG